MRYRFKLINFKSSEKNRIQNSLTVSNIMISSVVSDTFGVSSMKIINHILDNPDDKDFDVSSILHASMQDKAETITKSINGKNFSQLGYYFLVTHIKTISGSNKLFTCWAEIGFIRLEFYK